MTSWWRGRLARESSYYCLYKQLGFWPRYQHAPIHGKFQSEKVRHTRDVLQRLSVCSPFHHLTQLLQPRLIQLALKFQIQIEPLLPQQVRQEQFNVQSRRLDAMLLKKGRGLVDHIENAHNGR